MSYLLSWKIVLFFFRIFIKEVKGLENISRKETHIITGNHNGYADGGIILYLFCKILNQKIYFFAAKLWYSFIYLKLFECITEGEAVKKGLEYLNKKQSIAILPEGRRNKTNIIKDFKTGVAALAHLSGKPVIIFGITLVKFPYFKQAVVKISKPIKFNKIKGTIPRQTLIRTTNKIMREVAKLSGKRFKAIN